MSPLPSIGQHLHEAIRGLRKRLAMEVIDQGVDLAEVDEQGRTPLMLAAHHPQPNVLALLLEKGAAVDAVDLAGNTALHHALLGEPNTANCWLCAMHLLRAGIPVDAVNHAGNTALHLCLENLISQELSGYADQVAFFIDHGAGLLIPNSQGITCADLIVDNPRLFDDYTVATTRALREQSKLDQATPPSNMARTTPRL